MYPNTKKGYKVHKKYHEFEKAKFLKKNAPQPTIFKGKQSRRNFRPGQNFGNRSIGS